MDALVQQIGQALLTYGAGGILAILGIGWGWLERKGRIEERDDRKEAQDKLEAALERSSKDTQAQADKLRELAEKWASLLERDKRGTR